MDRGNDGRFPDDSRVEIRYPRTMREEQGDRSAWPWLPGSILEQCGPDEWYVGVEVMDLALLEDGRRAPARDCQPGPVLPVLVLHDPRVAWIDAVIPQNAPIR